MGCILRLICAVLLFQQTAVTVGSLHPEETEFIVEFGFAPGI